MAKKADKDTTKDTTKVSGVTESLEQPAKVYTSKKIPIGPIKKATFRRADLVFHGIDHSGASFEARVFVNNQRATAKTATTAQNGYAGTFHIFGHGGCFGDVGHCEVRGLPRPYDPRPAHPLTPARKVVIATEAIRKVAARSKEITVTVVPIVLAGTPKCDYENVLKFEKISVVTYR